MHIHIMCGYKDKGIEEGGGEVRKPFQTHHPMLSEYNF